MTEKPADPLDLPALTWKDGTPVRARMSGTPDDYRDAPSGVGPHASEWENKPHRLIYDLAGEVLAITADRDQQARRADEAERERDEIKGLFCGVSEIHAVHGRANAIFDGEGVKWFAKLVSQFFYAAGGKNYVEWQCSIDTAEFVLTCQRKAGKTPDGLKREAEKELATARWMWEGLLADLAECYRLTGADQDVKDIDGKPEREMARRAAGEVRKAVAERDTLRARLAEMVAVYADPHAATADGATTLAAARAQLATRTQEPTP